ncbi:hypothetical protein Tco_0606905 [Tanacetum coccineum]
MKSCNTLNLRVLLSNESLSSQTIGVNAIAQSLVPKVQFNLQLSSKEKSDRAKVLLLCEHQGSMGMEDESRLNWLQWKRRLLKHHPIYSVSYTIEVLCTTSFEEEKDSLRTVGARILSKRPELSKFKTIYK